MKILRQTALLLSFLFAGEALKTGLHLPFPGTVLGMVLLLVALGSKIIRVEQIDELSTFLLDHLAFFFLPAGVGLIAYLNILRGSGPTLLLLCVLSTILIMVFTGICVQFLIQLGEKRQADSREDSTHG